MREQTISMVEFAVALIVFMGACWFSFHMQAEIDAALETANQITQDQNTAIMTEQMSHENEDNIIFQGSEVLFMLRDVQQGKFSMSVDGVLFPPGMNPEETDLSIIHMDALYQAHYTYSTEGKINRIQQYKVR